MCLSVKACDGYGCERRFGAAELEKFKAVVRLEKMCLFAARIKEV